MEQEENKKLKLYLVGFSDKGGSFSRDLVLSRFRALAVRGQLLEQGVSVSQTLGLGSFMPVASNSKEGTKLKNGRVEVWVAPKHIY